VLLARPAGEADHALLHRCRGVGLEHLRAVGDVGEAVVERERDAVGRGRPPKFGVRPPGQT
jgi:hypothetical protein